MSDREALLAAIRANPDDDLPRLVYADWLEENADSLPSDERHSAGDRAAFIRAQVEAARAEPFSPAARDANQRADRLLHSVNREIWTWPLRGKILDAVFERGFVEKLTVDVAQFPEVAEAIFEMEPVRSLRAVRPSPSQSEYQVLIEPFFETPQLQQITSLDLQRFELMQIECEYIAARPNLAGLTHLSLCGNGIFPPWFREFFVGESWPNLTSLDLADISHLGPAIAGAFRKANHRRLTRLNLSGIGFLSDDLKRALGSECVSEVEELRLRWDGGEDRSGPLTLLEMGWVIPWGRLRLLDLEGQGIGSSGAREIACDQQAANLRWLGLARNHLGPSGVRELLDSKHLKLYYLDVRQNDISPKDAIALQKRFPEAQIVV